MTVFFLTITEVRAVRTQWGLTWNRAALAFKKSCFSLTLQYNKAQHCPFYKDFCLNSQWKQLRPHQMSELRIYVG